MQPDETQPPAAPSAARDALDWNVLATSREGEQRHLKQALRRIVRLRAAGYRNVSIGKAADVETALDQIAALRAARPQIDQLLGKVLPIERTFLVEVARFDAQLREQCAPFVDRLAGRSFHVRIERRGHKGVINTHAAEQALGDHVYTLLEQRGQRPVVTFRDPDAVLVVEVIGNMAGVGLVTREARQRWPFVHID